MARPSVKHGGFIIPNAGSVSEPVLSEPDAIDFNTAANSRWGVLTGCLVAAQGGTTVSVQEGAAMVNGKFVVVNSKTDMQVKIPSGAPKFDLVVVDDTGNPYVIPGKESNDPVYPDPPLNTTVLAAVYCRTGLDISDYVIDKRKFLAPALLTKVDPVDDLIRNYNSPGATIDDPPVNFYRVYGSGETVWLNDTRMKRSDIGTLQVSDHLSVLGTLTGGTIKSKNGIEALTNVTAKNLRRQSTVPTDSKTLSDVWQDPTTGKVYICNFANDGQTLEWDEIATFGQMLPVGTVITSLESPVRMAAAGWLSLDGTVLINEQTYPNLFKVASLIQYHKGIAPDRTMYLPNLSRRVLMADFSNPGYYGPDSTRSNNVIYLDEAQLPPHLHNVKTKNAGKVTPTAVIQSSGAHPHTFSGDDHSHDMVDPGHIHGVHWAHLNGASLLNATSANLALAVLTLPAVDRAKTNGSILESFAKQTSKVRSLPLSFAGGAHTHPVIVNPISDHQHGITEDVIGDNAGIDITPNYFTVYAYIRS